MYIAGFWLNHPAQCAELFSDKETGFVRTAWSAAVFAMGWSILHKAASLPALLLDNVAIAWRWVINHERTAYGTLVVVSCEFLPRIARELVSHINLHLQASNPDTWVRIAWIVVAMGALCTFVLGGWRVAKPFVQRFVFDDA